MPTFVPVVNTAKFGVEHMLDGQVCVNTFYVRHPTGWDVTSLAGALNVIRADWVSLIMPLLNEGVTLLQLVARDLTTQFGVSGSISGGVAAGGITGEAAPNNVSFAVKVGTGFAGRGFRGRKYIVGISNSKVTGNTIDATWADDVVTAFYSLRDDINSSGWDMVHVTYVSGGVAQNPALTSLIESFSYSDLTVDSQRRRLPGRGS